MKATTTLCMLLLLLAAACSSDTTDASSEAAATNVAPSCGGTACPTGSLYWKGVGGVQLADAGAPKVYRKKIPAACANSPTCGCLATQTEDEYLKKSSYCSGVQCGLLDGHLEVGCYGQ